MEKTADIKLSDGTLELRASEDASGKIFYTVIWYGKENVYQVEGNVDKGE